MNKENIESEVSDVILQTEIDVVIGGKHYLVAPPSTATLIMVSKKIAQLPVTKLDPNNVIAECLSIAKDCGVIGDIVAILILGAKRSTRRYCFGLFDGVAYRQRRLAKKVLEELTTEELGGLLSKLLVGLNISFFFGITTSLVEINLLRPTKKTTASGQ